MELIIAPQSFLNPQLSLQTQAFFRTGFGVLLLGTLIMALPQWRRFFISEKWGGYAKSSPGVDLLQNPIASATIGVVWFASAFMLIFNYHALAASIVNLFICRYFFIWMRWRGVLRGMGAPGFMTYWLAIAVFLLELTTAIAPEARSLAILVAQVDFAFIMLSAGVYKFTAGYAQNEGMEYGMVNPEWGYWWELFKKVPPSNWIYRMLNHLAWGTEVVAAALMLLPATRFIGGLLMLISFIFIAMIIRLGLLTEMVILGCVLFFHPFSIGDVMVANAVAASGISVPQLASTGIHPWVTASICSLLWAYLILLPIAHGGLFYNFYCRKSLPGLLQRILETYTNFFGLIIWRVFSVDVVNFFPMIYIRNIESNERKLISKYGWRSSRYNHVGESICVTSLFTTMKYYATNQAIFDERILRYSKTVPCPANCVIEYEYMSVRKQKNGFEFVPVALYTVDPRANTVEECVLDETISVRQAHTTSPVHEGGRPGSYVPLGG